MCKKILFIIIVTFNCYSKELIIPIPLQIEYNVEKARLGQMLFFEKKLSSDNSISCSTCHDLSHNGADNLEMSFGVDGQKGLVNTPTVFNSRYNFVQFFNGSAASLEEQVWGPIHNPVEMNSNINQIKKKLIKDTKYIEAFGSLYKGIISEKNISDAIAEFERTLVTPNSKFDRYLRGDKSSLSKIQIEGFELFKKRGCISCHNGINIGGNLFQKFGIIKDINIGNSLGRYEVTKKEIDKYYFKVPSLRNIEKTAPYFHTGKVKTLEKAIDVMYEYQLGIESNEVEVKKLKAFLKSLTG